MANKNLIQSAEHNGQLYTLYKAGTKATTVVNTPATMAAWIMTNIYDTDNARRDLRQNLSDAIATACGLFQGVI